MASTSTSSNHRQGAAKGSERRRAATAGPVKAPAPPPDVEIDATSGPDAGGSSGRTKRTRPPMVQQRATDADEAAERSRSAGESRAAATRSAASDPESSRSPGHRAAPGPVGASVTLPFVDVTVAVPRGAHVHVGPVQVDLGPKALAVAGAAGVVAAGVVEWPIALGVLGAGLVARRLTWRH